MSDLEGLFRDFRARVDSQQPLPVVHKAFGARPLLGHAPSLEREIVEPALPRIRLQRIEDLLQEAARSALSRVERKGRMASRPYMVEAFETAVQKCAQLILDAASKKDALKRVEQMRRELLEERKAKRKALAAELATGRRRLRETQASLKTAEHDVARARAMVSYGGQLYPSVPPPILSPHREGEGLPAEPGIYFLWRGEVVEYVGKSIRLNGRVRLPGHHVLRANHRISYVLLDERELTWAECYYIGTLRPMANFGASASHNKVPR